jgi:cytochrome c1
MREIKFECSMMSCELVWENCSRCCSARLNAWEHVSLEPGWVPVNPPDPVPTRTWESIKGLSGRIRYLEGYSHPGCM